MSDYNRHRIDASFKHLPDEPRDERFARGQMKEGFWGVVTKPTEPRASARGENEPV